MKKIFMILVYIFAVIGFVLVAGYAAVEFGLTKTKGIVDTQHDYFQNQIASSTDAWKNSEEWGVLKQAIVKDKDAITKAAQASGVSARMIATPLVVEQLRLYTSDREVYKTIFAPLKILGNQSQFSWGVMGIKQDTAREIEANLKNPQSPFYLGPEYRHILDFSATTTDPDAERFNRLTDENNRYYSYLYTGIYIREIESQWQKASVSIADKPDIVATLFNIGFENSKPHADPQSGGAEIDINGVKYSFGGLAESFYDSGELTSEFPR